MTFLVASLLLAFVGGAPAARVVRVWAQTLRDPQVLSLAAAVGLLGALGAVLKRLGFLDALGEACLHGRLTGRYALAIVPSVLGSVLLGAGSAALTGPLADSIAEDLQVRPSRRLWLTHGSFHIFRFCAPYIPSLLLITSGAGVSVPQVALRNLPVTAIGVLAISVWGKGRAAHDRAGANGVLRAVAPLGIVGLSLLLHMPLVWSVLLGIGGAWWPGRRLLWREALAGIDWAMGAAMITIAVLQRTLLATGLTALLPRYIGTVPPAVALVGLPFLLTLVNPSVTATVGLAMPLLMPYLNHSARAVALAYAAAAAGQLMSPVNPDLLLHERVFRARSPQDRLPLYLLGGALIGVSLAIYGLTGIIPN